MYLKKASLFLNTLMNSKFSNKVSPHRLRKIRKISRETIFPLQPTESIKAFVSGI